jgi:acetoacetyl-CoA synthetase
MTESAAPIWTPSTLRIENSRLHHYMRWLEKERQLAFADYPALWQWSVDHLEDFWASIWDYFEIRSSAPYTKVLGSEAMPGATWFEGARLNLAEQVFRFYDADIDGRDGDHAAIIAQSELRGMSRLSWRDLRRQITAVANTLRVLGIGPGDRVVALSPSTPVPASAPSGPAARPTWAVPVCWTASGRLTRNYCSQSTVIATAARISTAWR